MTGGVPVVVNGVPRVPNPEPVAPSEAINDLILVPVWTKVGLMYDEKTAERLLNDPVSRHLHQDFAQILVSQTVGEALDGLRRHPPQGRILYLYVVDDQGRLAGVVPTRRLLLQRRNRRWPRSWCVRWWPCRRGRPCWRRASSSSSTASWRFPWWMRVGA